MANKMRTPKEIRRDTLELYLQTGGHLPSSLSVVEILLAIYGLPLGLNDRFILSKGHGCQSWYVVLRDLGLNPPLKEHPDICVEEGIECTTGSLGHGLPIGVGMALGKMLRRESGTIFVVMSDGECQEGTTWESALLAAHHRLSNLCVVIDRNFLQSLDWTSKVTDLGSLVEKFTAFGWLASKVNGHSISSIQEAVSISSDIPRLVVAHTVKGKGISFMENVPAYHKRTLTLGEIEQARKELL